MCAVVGDHGKFERDSEQFERGSGRKKAQNRPKLGKIAGEMAGLGRAEGVVAEG